jgi:prolipoprotein diacylglyceryl transferase
MMDSINPNLCHIIHPCYIIWDTDPEMFAIPIVNHPVRWYGFFFALAFLASFRMVKHLFAREGIKRADPDQLAVYGIIGTVAGARLGHCLFYEPKVYLSDPLRILFVWEGGLASHGGALGILLALYAYKTRANVNYFWLLDRIVIVAALSGVFIRTGNFFNSEIVGTPSRLPWATVFARVDELPRHPVQLYEALCCLGLFVFLYYHWSRTKAMTPPGRLTGWFLTILFGLRFCNEFIKLNQVTFENEMTLNLGQLLSIPFVIAGVTLLGITQPLDRSTQSFP